MIKISNFLTNRILSISPLYIHPIIYYFSKKIMGELEKEMLPLSDFLQKTNIAIDIGANKGIYSYFMSQFCETVETFEPQPWCTESLKAYSEKFNRNINIHTCGLSNTEGELTLNIPIIEGRLKTTLATGLASFKAQQGKYKTINVPVYCLDKFNFKNVGFIKIDVEGHENKVIEGAKETITREKPIILVEIEQRHLENISMDTIFKQIYDFGYRGKFFQKNNWIELEKFSYEKHQKPYLLNINSPSYINNFLFLPI